MAINVFVNHPIVFSVANTITNQNAWCLHENCSEMDMCGIKCRVNFIEFNIFSAVDRKTVSVLSFIVYMLMIVFAVFVTALPVSFYLFDFQVCTRAAIFLWCVLWLWTMLAAGEKKINTQQVMLGRRNWYTLGKHKQANERISERERFHAHTPPHTNVHARARLHQLVWFYWEQFSS